MDCAAEERFVRTYIRKNRRERLLYELTAPKKRYAGLERFCHGAGDLLDPEKIRLQEDNPERQPLFEALLRRIPGWTGGECGSPRPGRWSAAAWTP